MADIRDRLIELLSYCSLDTSEDVQYVADKLIAADVAPVVHGRWCDAPGQPHVILCSVCGAISVRGNCNYCPNCGARMDGE